MNPPREFRLLGRGGKRIKIRAKVFIAATYEGDLMAGGLHGLAPMGDKPGQRGKHFFGQYFEAFPNHAAQLDLVLTEDVAKR